jgi:hypothetical protein
VPRGYNDSYSFLLRGAPVVWNAKFHQVNKQNEKSRSEAKNEQEWGTYYILPRGSTVMKSTVLLYTYVSRVVQEVPVVIESDVRFAAYNLKE